MTLKWAEWPVQRLQKMARKSYPKAFMQPIRYTFSILFLAWHINSVVAAAPLIAAGDAIQTEPPIVENGSLKIGFDPHRGALQQFSDVTQHHDFIEPSSKIALWQISTADGRQLSPDDANSFTWHQENDRLTLEWSHFQSDDGLRVTANIFLDDHSTTARWQISVTGLRKAAIRTIAFPRIGLLTPSEQETLAVPQWIGEITGQIRKIVNPMGEKKNGARREWDYPGLLSMQFIAYYTGAGPGMLVAADDTQLLRKQFAVFGDGAGGLGLEVIHHVAQERNAALTFATPYSVTVQSFSGDWFTAAVFYRKWARNQHWVQESRARRNQTPDWVRNTALWVWNRGTSANVLSPAVALQDYADLPVSVFWHWWHGCAYDVGFPEYFPPREGNETFRQAVAVANATGIHEIVYLNQRLWGMTTKSWTAENAAVAAVKDVDGKIHPEIYNTFEKAPCASMCMGTTFWRNKYAGLAERAVKELGVSGIYMDQACTSLACYDPSHGHPLGGGAYWMDGFKTLELDIRKRCSGMRDVALAGEGCGEGWLPYLDLMLSLQVSMERYAAPNEWEPVPLFNVVYHDCAIQFGNYSSLTRPPYDELWPKEFAAPAPLALLDQKFATQFRLEQARAFVWGQQPSIANFQILQLQERREEIAFAVKLAKLRMKALKYLRDGVFLQPPALKVPQLEIPISRLSIYAGQQEAVKEYSKQIPLVLASAFRAKDEDIAIALVNISSHLQSITIPLNASNWPCPSRANLYRLSETERLKIRAIETQTNELTVDLPPEDAVIYEFAAD